MIRVSTPTKSLEVSYDVGFIFGHPKTPAKTAEIMAKDPMQARNARAPPICLRYHTFNSY